MEFRPYSKETQLRGHQKQKDKPKYKEQRYKSKKKKSPLKQEMYKGRTIPSKQQRGKITTKEYNEALRRHGEFCYLCGTTFNLEAHHIKFRSQDGRGTFRNTRFLCSEHHRGSLSPHQDQSIREQLETLHRSLYGPFYYMDKYDLYKLGAIPNTTSETYENFMRVEEEKCQKNGLMKCGTSGNEK